MLKLFTLCLAMIASVEAQVNIEKYRGRPGISGKVEFQFAAAAGNSEFFDGGATANITYTTQEYAALVIGRGLLGFASGKRFDNQGLLHLRLTRLGERKVQPEIFFQSDYARPRRLVARLLFGAGVRSILHNGEMIHLSVGNSLMWEREHYDLSAAALHAVTESLLRSSNYVNLQLRRTVNLQLAAYYQFTVDDPSDGRILAQFELSSAIVGPLEQTTALRYRLDTEPPDDVRKGDLYVGTSFALNF